jgi:hypothetical protein
VTQNLEPRLAAVDRAGDACAGFSARAALTRRPPFLHRHIALELEEISGLSDITGCGGINGACLPAAPRTGKTLHAN